MFLVGTMGGFNSVRNVVESKPAPNRVSGFFPASQRSKIRSESVISAGGAGRTFRPATYEMQSILETHLHRLKKWIGSPYAQHFAVTSKRKESKELAASVEVKSPVIPRMVR